MAQRLIDEVFDALDEQTVVVPGTGTLGVVIPSPARSLAAVHEQRRALEPQIGQLLEAHPLSPVLTSIPGVAVRTAATLLVTVDDGTSFPTTAHLASYDGLAPTTPCRSRPSSPRSCTTTRPSRKRCGKPSGSCGGSTT
jgi:transposase